MDAATRQLIEAVHGSPCKVALVLTGGGASAAGLLLSVPGGSRTVLDVAVPYHEQALAEYLGARPEHFCSAETARRLAARAYDRARWLAPGEPAVGVGATASLASDRPKRGDHRLHVATHTGGRSASYSLTLTKGARDREGEEAVLATVILNALAEAVGVAGRLDLPLLPGEELRVEATATGDPLERLLRGELAAVCAEIDGRLRPDALRPEVVLPGSFNPVHDGHRGMAAAAERRTGRPVAFELSAANADKPSLTAAEVRRRLAGFAGEAAVWVTRAPTFAEKVSLFPGVTFVVGADTAARIVAPRFYGDSDTAMQAALAAVRDRGCRFLVAGRCDAAGRFVGLADLAIPPPLRDLFAEIPEADFRLDISSTQLRSSAIA